MWAGLLRVNTSWGVYGGMERLPEFLKTRIEPLNADSLEGTGLTVERVRDLAARYGFEPIGVVSLHGVDAASLEKAGDVASAIREFLQNAMNAQCGPRIMCKPLIEYRDGELLIGNQGGSCPECCLLIYGFSEWREKGGAYFYRGALEGTGCKGALAWALANGRGVATYWRHGDEDLVFMPVMKKVGGSLKVLTYVVGWGNFTARYGQSVVVRLDAAPSEYRVAQNMVFSYWLDMLKSIGVAYDLVPLHEAAPYEKLREYVEAATSGQVTLGEAPRLDASPAAAPRDWFETYVALIHDKDVENRVYLKDVYLSDYVGEDPRRNTSLYHTALSYNLYFLPLEKNRLRITNLGVLRRTLELALAVDRVLEHFLEYRHRRYKLRKSALYVLDGKYDDVDNAPEEGLEKTAELDSRYVATAASRALEAPRPGQEARVLLVKNSRELAEYIINGDVLQPDVVIWNPLLSELAPGLTLENAARGINPWLLSHRSGIGPIRDLLEGFLTVLARYLVWKIWGEEVRYLSISGGLEDIGVKRGGVTLNSSVAYGLLEQVLEKGWVPPSYLEKTVQAIVEAIALVAKRPARAGGGGSLYKALIQSAATMATYALYGMWINGELRAEALDNLFDNFKLRLEKCVERLAGGAFLEVVRDAVGGGVSAEAFRGAVRAIVEAARRSPYIVLDKNLQVSTPDYLTVLSVLASENLDISRGEHVPRILQKIADSNAALVVYINPAYVGSLLYEEKFPRHFRYLGEGRYDLFTKITVYRPDGSEVFSFVC